MPRPEETLVGRYDLLDVLGRGGMGVVYRARDRTLDRVVAVKVLPAALAGDATLAERFEREAKAAARLNHPNIVAVYDTGADRGARYIVMECVPGESLAQRLNAHGPLPPPEAAEIAAQISSALAAAHAAGIIHRDIKPGNVMVQPTGSIKVLDFGIARATAEAALTKTATLLGSAPYMAPEVALGRPADARSDIYSLGCVLYEMLTGRPPFVGDLAVAVMNQHTSAPPKPPREFDPAIPRGLEALVLQMLAKEPADRPQQTAALVSSLRASVVAPESLAATRVIPPDSLAATPRLAPPAVRPPGAFGESTRAEGPIPGAADRSPGPGERLPRSDQGRAWIIVLALIVALIAGVAVAVAIVSSSGSGTTSSTASLSSSSAPPSSGQSSSTLQLTTPSTAAHTRSTPSTSSRPTSTTSSTPTTSSTSTTGSTAGTTSAPGTGTTTAP